MVAAIDFGRAVIEQARTFAPIAQTDQFFGTADSSDQRAPQQSLKIEGQIRTKLSGLFQPGPQAGRGTETGELAPRKDVNVINILIAAQKRCPFRIDQPGNRRVRVGIAHGGDRGERMDDITERAGLYDKDGIQSR